MTRKEIELVLGGKKRREDPKSNFENPIQFYKKVRAIYNTLKDRSTKHRSI